MVNSRRLAKGPVRCVLMINPADAAARRLQSGQLVEAESRVGKVQVACEISDDVMPGTVSLPHGYGHDRPVSGNAALTGVPVSIAAVASMVAAQ